MHLITPERVELPSVEGLLVSRRRGEYLIGVPALLVDPQKDPDLLASQWLAIPKERVAFFEVIA